MSTWTVFLSRKAFKQFQRLPQSIKDLVDLAVTDLEEQGVRPENWDVKKTSVKEYRLRLTYRYRMRYHITDMQELEIEVFYLGHRRDAYR